MSASASNPSQCGTRWHGAWIQQRACFCMLCDRLEACVPAALGWVCVNCIGACVEVAFDRLAGALLAEQEREGWGG